MPVFLCCLLERQWKEIPIEDRHPTFQPAQSWLYIQKTNLTLFLYTYWKKTNIFIDAFLWMSSRHCNPFHVMFSSSFLQKHQPQI